MHKQPTKGVHPQGDKNPRRMRTQDNSPAKSGGKRKAKSASKSRNTY